MFQSQNTDNNRHFYGPHHITPTLQQSRNIQQQQQTNDSPLSDVFDNVGSRRKLRTDSFSDKRAKLSSPYQRDTSQTIEDDDLIQPQPQPQHTPQPQPPNITSRNHVQEIQLSHGDIEIETKKAGVRRYLDSLNIKSEMKVSMASTIVIVGSIIGDCPTMKVFVETVNPKVYKVNFTSISKPITFNTWTEAYNYNKSLKKFFVNNVVHSSPCDALKGGHKGECCWTKSVLSIHVSFPLQNNKSLEVVPVLPSPMDLEDTEKTHITEIAKITDPTNKDIIKYLIATIKKNYMKGVLRVEIFDKQDHYEIIVYGWKSTLNWNHIISFAYVNMTWAVLAPLDISKSGTFYSTEKSERYMLFYINRKDTHWAKDNELFE